MYFPFQYALTPSKFVLLIALALKTTIYPKICQNHCLRMQKAHFRLTSFAQERLFLISSLMFLVSDRLLSLCRRDIAGCTSGYIGKILETVPLAMSERLQTVPRNSPRIRHRSEYIKKGVHGIGNCILQAFVQH